MPTRNSAALEHCKLALRVTNDHGCWPVVQILAKFSPNNQNQPVAGCSVFGFCRRRNFLGFGASGRDWALRSRPIPPVATKARSTQIAPMGRQLPQFCFFDIPFIGLEVLACLTGTPPPPTHGEGRKTFYAGVQLRCTKFSMYL